MLSETSLNVFSIKKIINEELHLPHNSKSAKIVTHVDLDGLISGITMFQLLKKQGIPENRITIEFAQYGDEKDPNHTNKFIGKKNEFVGVTDFAALPKAKPYDIYNKLLNFKGNKLDFYKLFTSKDWLKWNQNDFNKMFLSLYKVNQTKWTETNLKELLNSFKAFKKLSKKPEINPATIDKLEYQMVEPDFVSDHHDNDKGALSGGKTGEIAVISPSEAEYLSNKYAPGLWGKEDLKAVSMIDSANYTEQQLKNTIFLEKNFSGPDKKKNLAIIISCIYDGLAKRDRNSASWVIKNAQPNLVSVYTNVLKAAKYTGKRLEYISALKSGEIDKAKQLLQEIPNELSKRYDRRGNPDKPVMLHPDWQEKNKKDMLNMKTGYKTEKDEETLQSIKGKRGEEFKEIRDTIKNKKGKVVSHNNFSIFNGTDSKTQYSRYSTVLYSKEGQRNPFTIRYWTSFFQASKSPLYKGEVNFAEVYNHVLEDIKIFLSQKGISDFNINRIIEHMKEKSGGHANGIWNFQGFDMIKPTSKEFPEKDKSKYFLAKRVLDKKIPSTKAKEIIDRYDSNGGINDKYSNIRKECMRTAMNSVVKWTNKLYPPSQEDLDKLKTNDKDFNEE